MKKYILFLLIILGFTTQAQQASYKGKVEIESHSIDVKDGILYVKIVLNKSSLSIPYNKRLAMFPILQDEQGNKKILPEIWINGTTQQKIYRREIKFDKTKEKYSNVNISIQASEKSTDIFEYNSEVKYESWMQNASLLVQEDECGCAGSRFYVATNKLEEARKKTPYTIVPHLSFISPPKEKVKLRNESFETYLEFPVGSSVIKTDFRSNPEELRRLDEAIETINNDETLSLTSIKLTGKTSPEGSVLSNNKLAYNRANALKEYLQQHHNIREAIYKVDALGEDWAKFKALLTTNYTQYDELLTIINSAKDPDIKEREIKKLDKGVIYKKLNEDIFPQLRRVTCDMNYTVRNFNIEESKILIYQNPQRLSLEEIYAVAQSYPIGSAEYCKVFEIAARLFPEDQITNNNAAAASILANQYEKAGKYLEKLNQTKEYYNNIGVLELLQGNYEVAEKYLEKSKIEGSSDAVLNLQELENKKDENNL